MELIPNEGILKLVKKHLPFVVIIIQFYVILDQYRDGNESEAEKVKILLDVQGYQKQVIDNLMKSQSETNEILLQIMDKKVIHDQAKP